MQTLIYARVSKSDGSQDVERQLVELREFAKKQNWNVAEEVIENISGRRVKRAGTEKIINLARSNKIQKVLVHEISRLGRNLADVVRTIEELFQCKVSVYDLSQKQETLDENHQKTIFANLIMPVLAGLGEEWVKQHSYRIKSGLKLAKEKGKSLGRPKATKLKKEDEIKHFLLQGFIVIDEFGRKIKASNSKIAKYLGISEKTVANVRAKNKLNIF